MAARLEKIGRYPVVGLLATGGMAEIHLCKSVGPSGFERPVVIKRVLPHLAREKEFEDMFVDEARWVANIRHPNVVSVHELGHEDGELFMVMEYLEGETVQTILRKFRQLKRRFPLALGVHIVAEACAGLHAAHDLKGNDGAPLNLVHRDVSPGNLFVSYTGGVKVIDFGIARAADKAGKTRTGHLKGKAAYMAPEQCMALEVDRRCDVFALGIVLFELTTGRRLFRRQNDLLVFQAIVNDPIPNPAEKVAGYPAELQDIVMRALRRDTHARYGSAADLRRDLLRVMRALSSDVEPGDTLARLMKELFAEQMEEKSDMVRRLQAGAEVEIIPESVRQPASASASTSDGGATPSGIDLDWNLPSRTEHAIAASQAPKPQRSRRPMLLVALGAAALLAAAAVMMLRVPAETAAPVAAPAEAPSVPAPVESETAASAAPATIQVHVATTPAGATVSVAGQPLGTTPTSVAIERGDAAVKIVVELAGHERLTEEIVPNVDSRLRLRLQPSIRAKPRPAAPQPSSRGFRRFD